MDDAELYEEYDPDIDALHGGHEGLVAANRISRKDQAGGGFSYKEEYHLENPFSEMDPEEMSPDQRRFRTLLDKLESEAQRAQ